MLSDSDEYELEEPDAVGDEVVRKQVEDDLARARLQLEIDQHDAAHNSAGDLDHYLKDFKFQYGTKHLMVLTAVVAVGISIWRIGQIAGLFLVAMVLLGGTHFYLNHREQKQAEIIRAKRKKLVAKLRAHEAGEEVSTETLSMYDEELEELEEVKPRPKLNFQFSIKHLLIVTTIACVVLSILTFFTPTVLAAILGVVAVGGLAVYAIGFEMPGIVVVSWWVILGLYIVLSAVAAFTSTTP